MNVPQIVKIHEVKSEAKDIKTLFFKYSGNVEPGQFFMVWIPDVDEIPMSISYIKGDIKGITFRRVGAATKALYSLKTEEKIGIRGPYGNGFNINGKNILFVGGGTGVATLAPAVEQALEKGISSTIIIGAKSSKEIFFEKRLMECGAKTYISTDDGSMGYRGYASTLAEELIKKNNFDSVLTCGPEKMMKILLSICKNIFFQASLERYMKCGIGICGQCCIGRGLRVCTEGPVFDGKTLRTIEEFGVYKRDSSGKIIRF